MLIERAPIHSVLRRRRRRLGKVLRQCLDLNFGGFQGDSFGEISFDVFQERLQRGLGQFVEVHVPKVCPHLVLYSVFLVDEHGLEESHPVVVCFSLGPAGNVMN